MEHKPNEVRVLGKPEHGKLEHGKLVLSMRECGMLSLNRLEHDIKELGMLGHKIEETRNPDPIVVVHYILLLGMAVVGIHRGSGDTDVVDRAGHRTQAPQPLQHWLGKLREPVLGEF